ncbi:MAG: ATPase, T2SS/T4P/T4SS family [Heliobacteriaceae bacterium]|nr:ATPase, T2SS/T4P/T4SS family [Heliobacteriaceae bacterium]MDD4587176.1 ATPase, T2SS/T4P/T4SS family [Heliobacteriaceae bacterium]
MTGQRKMLGDLLVGYGLISPEQLAQALAEHNRTGERLGKVVVRLGLVTERQINDILEFQLGIPQVSPLKFAPNPAVVKLVPETICRGHKCLPLKKVGDRLTVAMVDPLNLVAIDDLKRATNLEIDPAIATEQEIEQVLNKVFGLNPAGEAAIRGLEAEAGTGGYRASAFDMELVDLDKVAAGSDGPVIRVVNTILQQAVKDQVSDIHIEIHEGKVRVRYRLDGLLYDILNLPRQIHAALLSRIKILAEMDIAEKRLPQDGRIQIKLGNKAIDLRVSTLPTIFGEKCVIRLLDKSNALLDLEQLGFQEAAGRQYRQLIRNTYGMILLTGPTGSGKTTTLYATIGEINSPEKNIVTIENPAEYVLEGVNQVQVNPKAGLDFAGGLRSILRQDPDVILVGEIRDRETAEIAVRAATTGHLVFSTLHTNDAAGAVTRLIDMGVEPFLVASSVTGIVAQRLVRHICPNCKTAYQPDPDSPERIFLGLAGEDRELTLYRGGGCMACNNTGYKGRLAIQEVMPVTAGLRDLILSKATAETIRDAAIHSGMVSLREDGNNKALQGLTTVAEVMRVAYVFD